MGLPYKISTLLYAFDAEDRVLLLERAREPNRGLWSPPGGKLETVSGESPHACACREAKEELGLELGPEEVRMVGVISERGYEGTAHWLMFLFEIGPRLTALPSPIEEGRFGFHRREALEDGSLELPVTDRERLWPWFWRYRHGFFVGHCECHSDGTHAWTLEQAP